MTGNTKNRIPYAEGPDYVNRFPADVSKKSAERIDTLITDSRWYKGNLPADTDLDTLTVAGEYWVTWSVSRTLSHDWADGYGTTGYVIVHAPNDTTPYPLQERVLGATLSGLPIRRATRALLANDYGWTAWRAETDTIRESIESVVGSFATFPDPHRITAFGDSQTDGGDSGSLWPEEESWPSRLGAKLGADYTVTNAGFSGATVDEMLMKVGAIPLRVTVPSSVANNDSVVVTPAGSHYGLAPVLTSFDVRLDGKNARINVSADGVWTLHNWTGGTIPAGTITFEPKVSGTAGDTAVVWIGGNDRTFGITGLDETVADHIIGGTQTLIEWLGYRVKNVMILGMQPRASEPAGTPNNDLVIEVNERLRGLYPGKFRSVFDYLRTDALLDMGLTPTSEDLADIDNGLMPRSVLSPDNAHVNKQAAQVIGEHFVHDYLTGKGWI